MIKVQLSPNNSNPGSPTSKHSKVKHSQKNLEAEQTSVKANELAQYFKGDEYGNSTLSLEMEEENFENIKNIFNLEELNDTEMLREFASSMCDESYREKFNIELEPARRIFVEATDKLLLLGEDTTDLIEHYNLPS